MPSTPDPTTGSTPAAAGVDPAGVAAVVEALWRDEIEEEIARYITIPALSPAFDPDWEANGHLAAAVDQVAAWMRSRPIEGLTVEVHHLPAPGSAALTPVVVAEIPAFGLPPGTDAPTVVLYGHLDKQPEMLPWREGLGPWQPVKEGDRLYGRGGADDGYSAYASMAAIEAVQRNGGAHARCLVLIEASEESGSPDLPAHLEALADRLGPVELVICLDSGCADYQSMWLTTSLRGLVGGVLTVEVLTEGVHSGSASGVVPSSFRIIRQLLDRVEDAATGRVTLASARLEIPAHRRQEAEAMGAVVAEPTGERFPLVEGARAMVDDPVEALLARTWRTTMSYTGIDGIPPTRSAGNVLRPSTSLKLSLRLPPTADPEAVRRELVEALTVDPPYGARVSFEGDELATGWNAPALAPWLRSALDEAAGALFGGPVQLMGEGGTIPFMAMLGHRFPDAQFVITGVLGPESNAHGPNEFLHVPYATRLTAAVALLLDAHAGTSSGLDWSQA